MYEQAYKLINNIQDLFNIQPFQKTQDSALS